MKIQEKFDANPEAIFTERLKSELAAQVEGECAKACKENVANLEEFKVEVRSEVQDLKTEWEGGARERQAFEKRVNVLSQRYPAAPIPDPLLAQVPALVNNVNASRAQVGNVAQAL